MTIELQRLAEQRLTPSMSVYDISNNVFLDVELLEPSLSYKLWQGMTLDYAETQILKAWNVSPRQREAFTKMTLKQVERFFL
ncbi:hypothetical protein [Vibrio gallicus]|uniref:hypothetical protein n=1 Tax=Vibrio gallicus TaxID=190897 RepID=UPI0021C36F10|nr:hypothetical protein [Vibrio gallicus]